MQDARSSRRPIGPFLDGATALVFALLALGVLAFGVVAFLAGQDVAAATPIVVAPAPAPVAAPTTTHVVDTTPSAPTPPTAPVAPADAPAAQAAPTLAVHGLALADLVDVADLPVVQAQLGYAPAAAPAVQRDHPALVEVEFIATEEVMEIAPGAEYTFWTFNGSVPGPMIRVRQGDAVHMTFMNDHGSAMPHNIDLHAVTGQGGGAEATLTMPGHATDFTFRALNPGVYVYHCATAPVGMHIANGMYGLIVVEPPEGYAEVDREYYVMQGDFYTTEDFGAQGLQTFDMMRAIDEDASYVLFNGRVGAIAGENALHAEVGETVRLFVGNGGPNLVSSFHVIGEIFDRVWVEGGTLLNEHVQTTLVPAGGSALVEFDVEVPSTLNLVDHSIFRTFNKGALGQIVVTGEEDRQVFEDEDEATRPFDPADAPDLPN